MREVHRVPAHLAAAHRERGVAGVIGSRERMLGRSVERTAVGHHLGRVSVTFVSLWFGRAVYDTQCELKVFEREALARHLDAPELLLAMLDAQERARKTSHRSPEAARRLGPAARPGVAERAAHRRRLPGRRVQAAELPGRRDGRRGGNRR